MVLCAIGVYGVAAFSTRTRRRELAIRAALGARRQDLTTLMLRTELGPVGFGIAVGLSGALLTGRRLFGTPFETNPLDAITYLSVGIGLLAVATIASYVPVRRASATNPAEALHM